MKKWSVKGFEAFSEGTFGNGGQNLYVSKKGRLQRIWRFDVNNDGYVDLLIANSHGYSEHPPVLVISDPAGDSKVQEILTQGNNATAVADLTGNGYDDLIVCSAHDGQHHDLPSYVYFGGPDGISEDRKIDLAAPGCNSVTVGDFNGDGKKEICYLIADQMDSSSADNLRDFRLRIYGQKKYGFVMGEYTDYPAEVSSICAYDIDNDGFCDLYCRTADGRWLILWGGADGFSMERSTEVGLPTNDTARFDVNEFGGGNVRYYEYAKNRIVTYNGKDYLFYADAQSVKLIHYEGRFQDEIITVKAPNIISGCGANLSGNGNDLVLLQIMSREDQHVLVYRNGDLESNPEVYYTKTPRDVLAYDYSETGRDDLIIVQGRDNEKFTTESLLYFCDASGVIDPDPKRFETYNAISGHIADFNGSGKKSIVFANNQKSDSYGHIPVYVYLGSKDGFKPENRLEFPGHSAGSMLPVDFNDDGYPDILVLQNAEDQPFKEPPADLYFGGPDGFSPERKTELAAPLCWGGQCADLNKDGYLDIIAVLGNKVRIFWGSENGYSNDNVMDLELIEPEDPNRSCGALWPAVADLNGNGWLDLVVPYSSRQHSRIFWGGPDGYSLENSSVIPVDCALTVRIADLNKDGYPDLVFGSRASLHRNYFHEGTVTIFWGGPDGYSGFNCCVLPSYQSNNITIADYNNDGYLDIFASSYFNKKERDINSYIYWNDHGHFSLTNRKRLFTHSSSAAWAGDFNEDGYVDLCVTNHRSYGSHVTESAIWWNGPDGFKEDNRTWLPTIGPHDMVPCDMGNVMTRSSEEEYISPAGESESLSSVAWEADIPWKTWVNCQIRTAGSPEELQKAYFIGKDGTGKTRFECGEKIPAELVKGRFFQVKLYLGAVNSGNSPIVTELFAED